MFKMLFSDEDYVIDIVRNEKSDRIWLRFAYFNDGHYVSGSNIELSTEMLSKIGDNLAEFINEIKDKPNMPVMQKFCDIPIYSVFLVHGVEYLKVSDNEATHIPKGGIGLFRPDILYEIVGYAQFIKN